MVVDYTITIGNLIEIGSIVGGGLLVLVTLRNTVTGLKEDVTSIQDELRKMGDILTKMAVAETRLDNTDTRLTTVERDIRELRHGQGFVRGPSGIDREYAD